MPDEEGQDQINETPSVSVSLEDIMGHKTDDGLNFFTDDHLERLKTWASDDPTKAKFRTGDGKLDVPKLTKSYLEAQSRISKLAKPLSDDATEAERFEYRKHLQQVLGVPDTPDGYELIEPKDLPEGVSVNTENVNALKIAAHKHNMSKEAVQAMFDLHNQLVIRQVAAAEKILNEQNTEVEKMLKAGWGPEEYSRQDDLLQRYIHDFAPTDEAFDTIFNGLQETSFAGGSDVKATFYRMLCKAAELVHGEGKNIYAQTEKEMNEKDELQKRFPKSYSILAE